MKKALLATWILILVVMSLTGLGREFSIPGMVAWNLAKASGFQFMVYGKEDPTNEKARYNDSPVNGVQSFLGPAQIIPGNCFVYKNKVSKDLKYKYFAFKNKLLAEGWTVKRVELEGDFDWS